MYKALLFDLDGVIVDTAVYHYKAWRKLANDKLGFDISEEFNENLKGISRGESLERILIEGQVEISIQKKEEFMVLKNQWYLDLIAEMSPKDILPGIDSFILEVKKTDLKLGLGSVSKNAKFILEKTNLIQYFDIIIDGNKISKGKPDPEVFLKGAEECGCSPTKCIVFEDAIAGVKAGKNAGMKVVGLGDASILTEADVVYPTLERIKLQDLLNQLAN